MNSTTLQKSVRGEGGGLVGSGAGFLFFYYKSIFKVRAIKLLSNVDLYNAHTLNNFGKKYQTEKEISSKIDFGH